MTVNTTTSDTPAELLDGALTILKTIGHLHGVDVAVRQHIEFAAAHIRQAWIADDGQRAESPEDTHKAVAGFYRLQAFVITKATGGQP